MYCKDCSHCDRSEISEEVEYRIPGGELCKSIAFSDRRSVNVITGKISYPACSVVRKQECVAFVKKPTNLKGNVSLEAAIVMSIIAISFLVILLFVKG